MIHRALIFALLVSALPATADQNIGGVTVDCYCTDKQGGRVELGQEICLFVGGRAFMARCEMSLNVPMWREIGQGCVSSGLRLPQSLNPAGDTGGVYPKI